MAKTAKAVCVAATGDRNGEGAVWHAAEQALYFTDVNRFLIHRFDYRSRAVRSWFFDEPVVALALTGRDDTLAVALGSRLAFWEPETNRRTEHGFRLPGWPTVRLNEGRPDYRGSMWLGSMRNNVNPDGSPREAGGEDGVLYRIDADGTVSEWRTNVGISNTLTWSPDRTKLYFGDTLANELRVYDYDEATGAISNERPFFSGFDRGLPDGSVADAEGYVWNCRYGGSCVVRIAPDGSTDQVVEMPVSNLTTCTFGGPDLNILYVTSANNGAPKGERFAGCLFAIETEVRGQSENRFLGFGAAQ